MLNEENRNRHLAENYIRFILDRRMFNMACVFPDQVQ